MSILNESVMDIADQMHKEANALQEAGEFPKGCTVQEVARAIRAYANRLQDARYMEELNAHRAFLEKESHDEGDLEQWYIHSVIPTDPPVWTEAHLKELVQDYWLIPKPMDERFKCGKRTKKKKGCKR